MKDCTKLFCDLISFGSQLAQHDAPMEQVMSCLAGIYLNNDCSSAEIILDYDVLRDYINHVKVALKGADNDIDVRARLAQSRPVSIKDIIEFHGRLTVKLNDGTALSYSTNEITHY